MTNKIIDQAKALDELRRIAALLLDPQRPAYSLRPEILEMIGLLQKPLTPPGDISIGETRTAGGLAISPTMAAMCAEDFVRTIQFIRGTHAAIADVCKQFPGRAARILYVGCGPFATLAIPLMAILPAADATFMLLEIHAESLASAKSIVGALGLAEHVACFEQVNAAEHRIDPENRPDIILMEIMQAGLEAEPQVAVLRHLAPQAPDAILIPEEVSIELALVDTDHEFDLCGTGLQRNRIAVATVFTLNRASIEAWGGILADHLPAATVHYPDSFEPQFEPMFITHIKIYGSQRLKDYDSGLTYPRRAPVVAKPGEILLFHYELGSHPGLRCTTGAKESN